MAGLALVMLEEEDAAIGDGRAAVEAALADAAAGGTDIFSGGGH